MKKLFKVLLSIFIVGCICVLGSPKKVGASSIYYATGTSTKHIYNGVTQYYTVNAEIKVVGSSTSFQDYTTTWKSSGTGVYNVNHSNITITQHGDGYKKFGATSYITDSTGYTHNKYLTAKVSY